MDPPELLSVKEFMKNNEELPEAVMKDLQRGLAKPWQELADLEAEIKELEGQITQLKVQRDRVEKQIAQYDCVLSPIRRLPADILHNIFYHCLPTRRDPIMNAKEAPLLLTRICRAWRHTAHASPPLWARLYITFSDEDIIEDNQISYGLTKQHISDTLRLRCGAVEEWLSRSGALPLSISLCYTSHVWVSNDDQSPGNSDNTLTLFRILARYSPRWQRLELTIPIEVYRILERMISISQLSMLNSVRASFLRQIDLGNGVDDEPVVSVLQVQNIQRISLSSYPTLFKTALSRPDLTKITSFAFHWTIPVTEAVSFLRSCPNLEYVWLNLMSDSTFSFNQHSTPGPISLPHLRALCIVDLLHSYLGGTIYDYIDAPLLEWVDYTKQTPFFDVNQTRHDPNKPPVVALLQKLKRLRKLTIGPNALTTAELRRILRSAQNITHLVLGPERRTNEDLLASSPIPRSANTAWNLGDLFLQDGEEEEIGYDSRLPLVPYLEVLEVSQGGSTHITDEMLLDVILRRMDPVASKGAAPLKKVVVLFSRPKQIDISKELSTHWKTRSTSGKMELTLEYSDIAQSQTSHFVSSEFNIDHLDRSWKYRDIEEEMIFSYLVRQA